MANIDSVKLPDGSEYGIASGGSNPNLLINPWFTVNQRGFTSGTNPSWTYTADRWKSIGPTTKSLDYMQLSSANNDIFLAQQFEDVSSLNGKAITASLMKSDGTIYSGTVSSFDSSSDVTFINKQTDEYWLLYWAASSSQLRVKVFSGNHELAIKAIKLELGSHSTLHLDTAPDYTTELLKCQRYFVRLGGNSSRSLMLTTIEKTDTARSIAYDIISKMRADPTLTYSGSFYINAAGNSYAVSSINLNAMTRLDFISSGMTLGQCGRISYGDNAYIDFNAEL